MVEPRTADRRVEIGRNPRRRRLVTGALRAGRHQVPVHGLLEVDVTTARARLRATDPPLSTTAYVVACVGRAAAEHPLVHAYVDWRGRRVVHRHVDVGTMLEVDAADGPIPMAHLIRNAESRSVLEISEEISRISGEPARSPSGRIVTRAATVLTTVPFLVPLGFSLAARSPRLRDQTGTVAVTSVGMFGGGGGAAILQPTIYTLGIAVGGISPRPWVVDDEIVIREVMDLSVTVDHNVVDGAPAARFAADLRRWLEDGDLLG